MRKIILLPIAILFISCGTGLKVRKENLKTLDKDFSGTYRVMADKSSGKHKPLRPAFDLFKIPNTDADFFTIAIEEESGELLLKYTDKSGRKNMQRFAGRLDKNMRYYEVYLNRKNIQFPPVYAVRNIDRLRIGLLADGSLIIDNKYAHDGMILLFAAGSSGRTKYFFLPKEATSPPSHP
jgi:hypothetical protein